MNSVLFGIFGVAILLIIYWYVENERVGTDSDGDKGLLAMRSTRKEPESKPRRTVKSH